VRPQLRWRRLHLRFARRHAGGRPRQVGRDRSAPRHGASDLKVIDGKPLPDLKDTEVAILERDRLPVPAERLKEFIVSALN